MHQATPSEHAFRECVMRALSGLPSAALASLFSMPALPVQAEYTPITAVSRLTPLVANRTLDRPASLDPPPPRS
jgi:hypothetical protein